MKTLQTYIECDLATPANTLGMGNPGEISQDTLTEPIGVAKSEVEKNKKKRKKKIKSLTESLFDDNISKELFFGDVLEFEEWECANLEDYSGIGVALDSTFSAKLKNKIIKTPKWKKFLSPFESVYGNMFGNLSLKQSNRYLGQWQLWVFTWVIMCCSTMKEISQKLEEFMNDIRRNIRDDDVFDEDFYVKKIKIVPLEGIGEDMKGLPRLVVIEFESKNRDITIFMKLKKRNF